MKTISRFTLQILYILFLVIFASCDKHEDNNNNQNNNNNNQQGVDKIIKFLTIADAKTLYIAQSNSKSGLNVNKLYKITNDGMVIEVQYLDSIKNVVATESLSPSKIYNLTPEFLLISFNSSTPLKYLIRKSDGAVFNAEKLPRPETQQFDMLNNSPLFQKDATGNIYYLGTDEFGQERNIIKLNLTDLNNIVATRYSAAGDQPGNFVVDQIGNMAYGTRFRAATGGFFTNPYGFICSTLNSDSIITARLTQNYPQNYLHFGKLSASNPMSLIPFGDSIPMSWFNPPTGGQYVKLPLKQKIFCLLGAALVEIENSEHKIKGADITKFGITQYQHVEKVLASNNFIYLWGFSTQGLPRPDVLVKFNPDDYSGQVIPISNDYEVYSIQVSPNDVLQLYALRLSDGNRVVTEIDEAGNIKVLQVLDNETITSMERIN